MVSGSLMVNTLLIDNYDSFTYNLYALLSVVNGTEPTVIRNDSSWDAIDFDRFDNIVVSPGPGSPTQVGDFGISARIIAETDLPLLGVCLGHQGLCSMAGARIVRAPEPVHGRLSEIVHNGEDLFRGLPSPFVAVRYHSLVVADLPAELEVTARTTDGLIMAVRHRNRPMWGLQFHPESIASEHGHDILTNFRNSTPVAGRPRRAALPNQSAALGSRPSPRRIQWRRIDHHPDPLQVYELFDRGQGAFWLDGTARGELESRFTVIGDGSGPHGHRVTYDVATSTVRLHRPGLPVERLSESVFDYLKRQLHTCAVEPDPALPFDFQLGFVGYLGYEMKAETGGLAEHRSPYPDAAFVFADRAVVIDHDAECSYALCWSPAPNDMHNARWLQRIGEQLERLEPAVASAAVAPIVAQPDDLAMHHRCPPTRYRTLIGACLDLIRAGETYEVCLTNNMTVDAVVDPLQAFQHLREINPAPYAALLECDGVSVISASPERFLRITADGRAESKPIKGTRARGRTAVEDDALRGALVTSEKERAENLMIVDLVRNDLSRVCKPGSVHVPTLFGVETYASVHQLVSTVRGTLRPEADAIDAVRALFPGGSMTGAPKVRTMAILDRLESSARGVYSGAIGYFSLTGTADLSIAIRTIVVEGTRAEFGVGGAITALSDPDAEYQETLVKAAALHTALRTAFSTASASTVSATS
jgi:para-aminobenzoate synthetase